MIAGLLAAFGFAGGVLVDKFELSKRHLKLDLYLPLLFFLLAVLSGITVFILPHQTLIYLERVSINTVGAFIAMICLAIGSNVYYYRGLAKEKVQELDLILLTEPLVTILLASFFFPAERHSSTLMVSLLAALALIYAHMHHRRIRFDPYARGLLISICLVSLEVLVIRVLLDTFSPTFLYFIRTSILFLAFSAIYRPQFEKLKVTDWFVVFGTAVFGVVQMLARYFGYAGSGVVITTLFLLLGPVLVEAASMIILRERLKIKTGLAFVIIFGCVAYVGLSGGFR